MAWKQDYAFFLALILLTKELSGDMCRYGAGVTYRGKTGVTKRNITCQNWDSNYPHITNYSSSLNPQEGLENNFCRNPNRDPAGPWCYTSSPAVRWEYCNIPMCGCREWEVQNGSLCTCKTPEECGFSGPAVCDSDGQHYPNYCAFAAVTCQERIPHTRTLGSCGKCSRLKLTHGEGADGEHPKYGLLSFEPTVETSGNRTVFESLSMYEDTFVLQYDLQMHRWIIGQLSENGQIYLAAFSFSNASWPQDSLSGWWIVERNENGTEIWKEDVYLQLHCFTGEFDGYLLGDRGYPCQPYLLTPYPDPEPGPQQRYNLAHCRTRARVEMTTGMLKARFQCLRRLRITPERACDIIVACVILYNIATIRGEQCCTQPVNDPDNDPDHPADARDGRAVRDTICYHHF